MTMKKLLICAIALTGVTALAACETSNTYNDTPYAKRTSGEGEYVTKTKIDRQFKRSQYK
jgi:outer membrane protein assembly factor BamE (lipoprotein component of BamABCDE complex)